MPGRFQSAAAVLGSSLFYPNAVVWSEENFVAVACDDAVIILNPSNLRVRGVISISSSKPFPVGVIDGEEDLLEGCLLPHNLSRETLPCVRSISWSPAGLANNAGCLISICTAGGRVKLYRAPFCELSSEWIEVVDISEMLYGYLKKINFGECDLISPEVPQVTPRQDNMGPECEDDLQILSPWKDQKRRRMTVNVTAEDEDNLREVNVCQNFPATVHEREPLKISGEDGYAPLITVKQYASRNSQLISLNVTAEDEDNLREVNVCQNFPATVHEGEPPKISGEDGYAPLITVKQYASRNSQLISLTVAWSPILGKSKNGVAIPHSSCCSFLAVGGKCGRISVWKINAPRCYSIDNTRYSGGVSLVGLFKAHDTWITVIDWALYGSGTSSPIFLLATGSSDGIVKIWEAESDKLLNSSDMNLNPFSLLKEVITVDYATISVLSFTMPAQTSWKLLLAIGKGSGSFEVWILDMAARKFERFDCSYAHDCIVTGLAWAFDGCFLYSCSQDNSMKGWSLVGNSLSEVPICSYTPGGKGSCDVTYAFDACFGLAISPGNLAIAVARRFDVDLLNPMYERSTHRAAVEFLWIGGQQLDPSPMSHPDADNESFPILPERELIWWERNLLWSLNRYEDSSKLLNIWDAVSALVIFKLSMPEYLDRLLLKWFMTCIGFESGLSSALLSEASNFLPNLSTRKLQLMNIISRRIVLKGCQEENSGDGLSWTKEQERLWRELLSCSENELLERLVGFTFSSILTLKSNSKMDILDTGCWYPDGLPLMAQWVSQKGKDVKDHSKILAKEVRRMKKRRLHADIRFEEDEQCIFCSSVVPFDSTEYATCSGFEYDDVGLQRHKLQRCAISMRILPSKPSWYCVCCQRRTTKLAPSTLFTMSRYPSNFKLFVKSSPYKESSTPCCPFCGILLQRSQPGYALSPSPV